MDFHTVNGVPTMDEKKNPRQVDKAFILMIFFLPMTVAFARVLAKTEVMVVDADRDLSCW